MCQTPAGCVYEGWVCHFGEAIYIGSERKVAASSMVSRPGGPGFKSPSCLVVPGHILSRQKAEQGCAIERGQVKRKTEG